MADAAWPVDGRNVRHAEDWVSLQLREAAEKGSREEASQWKHKDIMDKASEVVVASCSNAVMESARAGPISAGGASAGTRK